MPSISVFFRFLDVRESRGALRPYLGGPAVFPKRTLSSRPQHTLQLVFAEIFFSGVPQKNEPHEVVSAAVTNAAAAPRCQWESSTRIHQHMFRKKRRGEGPSMT